jgi:hypothetical protein
MVISVRPTLSPTTAFLLPPLGKLVKVICAIETKHNPINKDNERIFLIAKFFLNLILIITMLLINLTEDNHGKAMVISKDKWLWKDLGCMLL